jgi:hypothetical protein
MFIIIIDLKLTVSRVFNCQNPIEPIATGVAKLRHEKERAESALTAKMLRKVMRSSIECDRWR